jgi:hypothetical protein
MKITIDGERVFTRAETAQKMGCGEDKIRQVTQKHKLGRRIGRRLFLTQQEIDFIANLPDRRTKRWRAAK